MNYNELITRNVKATRVRTAIITVAVAVVVALLFSTFVIELGVTRSTEIGSQRLGADILLLPSPLPNLIIYIQWKDPVFITPTNTTAHLAYLRPIYINDNGTIDQGIAKIQGVTAVSPQLYVGSLNYSGRPVSLVGFDPATDFTILPWLRAGGQGLPPLNSSAAIVGSDTGYVQGDTIRWGGLDLKVASVLEPTSSSMDNCVFFPIQTAYTLARNQSTSLGGMTYGQNSTTVSYKPGQITAVLIKISDTASESQVGYQVSHSLNDYVVIYGAIATKHVALETRGIATYEFFLSGLLGTSVLILIASLISMSVNERKREFGLLRAIGATKRTISRLVMTEIGVVALIGSVLGLVIGGAVLVVSEFLLSQSYKISFAQPTLFDLLGFMAGSLALGLLIGVAASAYPAYAASRKDPYEAITRGE